MSFDGYEIRSISPLDFPTILRWVSRLVMPVEALTPVPHMPCMVTSQEVDTGTGTSDILQCTHRLWCYNTSLCSYGITPSDLHPRLWSTTPLSHLPWKAFNSGFNDLFVEVYLRMHLLDCTSAVPFGMGRISYRNFCSDLQQAFHLDLHHRFFAFRNAAIVFL